MKGCPWMGKEIQDEAQERRKKKTKEERKNHPKKTNHTS